MDDDNELSKALRTNLYLRKAELYSAKGRRFADLSDDHWIVACKLWAANRNNQDNPANEANWADKTDLEAEMFLRQMEPPWNAVEAEIKAFGAEIQELIKDQKTREDILNRLEASLEEDYSELFHRSKSKN